MCGEDFSFQWVLFTNAPYDRKLQNASKSWLALFTPSQGKTVEENNTRIQTSQFNSIP